MKVQGRILVALGVTAAAIGIAVGVRHCLRSMAPSGGIGGATELRQRRSGQCCGPVDGGQGANHDQGEETAALAA